MPIMEISYYTMKSNGWVQAKFYSGSKSFLQQFWSSLSGEEGGGGNPLRERRILGGCHILPSSHQILSLNYHNLNQQTQILTYIRFTIIL
jgi:hypothetical protein